MERLVSLLVVLILCCNLILPTLAEEFVPSITYKDVPDILDDPYILEEDEREKLDKGCLEITPVSEALAIPEAERTPSQQKLVEVYGQLVDGSMKLPVGNKPSGGDDTQLDETKYYIVRDLFDASMICGRYHTDPSHVEQLERPGVYLELTFDVGVEADEEIVVMVFIDGVWTQIEEIINHGDGTLTCLFEDSCQIAFCVEDENQVPAPPTDDVNRQELIFWLIMLVSTSALLVVMVSFRRKFAA
jgi:hypothetical protein